MAVLKLICRGDAADAYICHVREALKHNPFAREQWMECIPYWKVQALKEMTFDIKSEAKVGKEQWERLFSAISGEWSAISGQTSLDLFHSCTVSEVERNPDAFFATMCVDGEEFA